MKCVLVYTENSVSVYGCFAMRVFHFALFSLFIFLPFVAQADPRCGNVDGGTLDDVYDLAEDVKYYKDFRGPIEGVCGVMEQLDDLKTKNSDAKKQMRALVDDVELSFEELYKDLKAIDLWLRADTDNDRERVLRHIRIRDARERAKGEVLVLEGHARAGLSILKTEAALQKDKKH